MDSKTLQEIQSYVRQNRIDEAVLLLAKTLVDPALQNKAVIFGLRYLLADNNTEKIKIAEELLVFCLGNLKKK